MDKKYSFLNFQVGDRVRLTKAYLESVYPADKVPESQTGVVEDFWYNPTQYKVKFPGHSAGPINEEILEKVE